MPTFKAWARDLELEDDAHDYVADDARDVAREHAEHGHSRHDWHECTWPIVVLVKDTDGRTYVVEVEREFEPTFNASRPLALDDFPPAIHVTESSYGMPLCGDIRLPPAHRDWPEGHHAIPYDKVTEEKLADGACAKCLTRYRGRVEFLKDVEERRKQILAERAGGGNVD